MVNLRPSLFGALRYVAHIILLLLITIKRMRLITRFYGSLLGEHMDAKTLQLYSVSARLTETITKIQDEEGQLCVGIWSADFLWQTCTMDCRIKTEFIYHAVA